MLLPVIKQFCMYKPFYYLNVKQITSKLERLLIYYWLTTILLHVKYPWNSWHSGCTWENSFKVFWGVWSDVLWSIHKNAYLWVFEQVFWGASRTPHNTWAGVLKFFWNTPNRSVLECSEIFIQKYPIFFFLIPFFPHHFLLPNWIIIVFYMFMKWLETKLLKYKLEHPKLYDQNLQNTYHQNIQFKTTPKHCLWHPNIALEPSSSVSRGELLGAPAIWNNLTTT